MRKEYKNSKANIRGSITMNDVKFDERWLEGLQGADRLSEKLCQVVNTEGNKDDLDQGERFLAALMLVADLIGNTQCAPLAGRAWQNRSARSCRKWSRRQCGGHHRARFALT